MKGTSTWRAIATDPADWFAADELDRSRRYQRPLTRLRVLRLAMTLVAVCAVILTGAAARLLDALDVRGWALQVLVVAAALQLLSLVYDVPLDWWVDLVHDRRWGLSTQTHRGFVADQLKSAVLGLVVNGALLIPLFAVIRATEWWWIWGWLIAVAFSVAFGFLFPLVVAPVFNRFSPLPPGELAERIDRVADRAGVRVSQTLVADESRRSRRDNAYVAGLGTTRRVVLFDTLLEQPVDTVEQVVAHEIGHWRLHHLRRQIPLVAMLALAVFVVLRAVGDWNWLLDRAQVDPGRGLGDPAALPIIVLTVFGGFAVTGLVGSFVSRAFERQADLSALELLRQPGCVIDMHRRIHVKNLADLDPSLLKRLQASHPPAAERMAFAARWATANGVEEVQEAFT
jgi:STE24 endopeptidase